MSFSRRRPTVAPTTAATVVTLIRAGAAGSGAGRGTRITPSGVGR